MGIRPPWERFSAESSCSELVAVALAAERLRFAVVVLARRASLLWQNVVTTAQEPWTKFKYRPFRADSETLNPMLRDNYCFFGPPAIGVP